ncbi:MAG: thiamine diphosphokinase [Clostridia bacterium]|nr:thiamine diphosphokinase [Clostridia bacterium]
MKTCYIVGAGDFFPERFSPGAEDYIIAADAGYRHLMGIGVEPDLVIGDFDSLGAAPERPNVIVCPVKKDDTDTLIAVRRALDMGFSRIMIFGGTGGRLDHTLANIQTIGFAAKSGAEAFLFGADFALTVLAGGKLRFSGYTGGFSIFSLGDSARGVCESGVKFPLVDAELTCDFPLGVSNEFDAFETEISVRQGAIIVFWRDNVGKTLPERENYLKESKKEGE